MRVDEADDARPGVVRCGLVLGLPAVEEAVRGALVGDQLVLDAGGCEGALEGGVVVCRDVVWSSPACSASTGASICAAAWIGPGWPLRSPVEP